jgi:hypothetical protein
MNAGAMPNMAIFKINISYLFTMYYGWHSCECLAASSQNLVVLTQQVVDFNQCALRMEA